MTPLNADPGTHVVAYVEPDGEPWFEANYGPALFDLGVETGNGIRNWPVPAGSDLGPGPILLRTAKSLSWSFGDIGTGVLTATDKASIVAMLEQGGNVVLVGLHFMAALDGEPGDFAQEVLGLEGMRAVRLGKSVKVPPESPGFSYLGAEVSLREECWNMVAHAPIPGPDCEVLMTTTTSKGERPLVVACGGNVLAAALRSDCFWDEPVVLAWFSALNWD